MKKKKTFIIHPFLFAMFPVVFLYNRGMDYVSFSDTFMPTAVILLSVLILGVIFYLIYRNLKKTGILISVFMIFFFSYGHIQDTMCAHGIIKSIMVRNAVLLVLWGMILLAVAYFLFKTKKELVNLTNLFNVMAVALIIVPLFNIITNLKSLNRKIDIDSGDIKELQTNNVKPEQCPDIYYLIYDRYSNNEELKKHFNFDNSEFTDYLKKEGFYVASKGSSNYPNTTFSIASSLNLQYLDDMLKKMHEKPKNPGVMAGIIEDSVALKFLKRKGYKFMLFGSWFQLTRKSRFADGDYNLSLLPEFSMVLYRTTMLYPITAQLRILDKRTEHWKRVMYKFEKLPEIADIKAPTFVFAHFLIPHDPYVFNVDGTFLPRNIEETRSRERKYTDQIKFVNRKIKELIKQIISRSKVPPVIIIQADEGSYPNAWTPGCDLTRLAKEDYKQKTGILNALYVPGADKKLFYPSWTPVNTFRLVFNTYFKTHLKILPDKNYIFYDKHWWRVLENPSHGPRKCAD